MVPPHRYLVLLDFKTDKGADRFGDLRRVLKNNLPSGASLSDLTINDSFQSPLAQLADLPTGCVTAAWCGLKPHSAKAALARYLENRGRIRLTQPSLSQEPEKINIVKISA